MRIIAAITPLVAVGLLAGGVAAFASRPGLAVAVLLAATALAWVAHVASFVAASPRLAGLLAVRPRLRLSLRPPTVADDSPVAPFSGGDAI